MNAFNAFCTIRYDMLPAEKEMIKAIEKVSPSVVSISIVRLVRQSFFNVVPQQGMGSGVIIDTKGHILTNYHIVEAAEKVEVALADGRKFDGKVVGTDNNSDIAVVKINADKLVAAELSDSEKLKVGQYVATIGNPFGFLLNGPTVTTGVVSALNRHLHLDERIYEDLIQTDAAINPGNSGGALIDSTGRVIGINTAIIPFAQGIGFAIAINTAKAVCNELIEHGRVIRPWIGISGVTVNPRVANYFDLPVGSGVAIVDVIGGGPAEDAGIAPGDVIVAFDKRELKSMDDMLHSLGKHKVGESVELQVVRGNKQAKVAVKLAKAP